MTRTIGIGVIGMGWMGEVHSRSYRAIPDRFHESGIFPRLIVCADPVEARALAAQQRFGFERYTTDWREVIADPAVEVVNVAAPNGMHLEINRAAAQAGKHILCEKPVGKDPQETIQSAAAARRGWGADLRRLQLSLGTARAVCPTAHRRRETGTVDPLSRSLSQRLCRLTPTASSPGALSRSRAWAPWATCCHT